MGVPPVAVTWRTVADGYAPSGTSDSSASSASCDLDHVPVQREDQRRGADADGGARPGRGLDQRGIAVRRRVDP